MIDLHCHSTFSDGSLTPEELVAEAERIGLTALALTDHDCLAGLERFLAAGAGKRIRLVPGIELSVDCAFGTMHMLGYWMRADDPELNAQLEWVRDGRAMRNREILRKLNELGMPVTWEEVKAAAGDGVVGRPHFAQVMLAKGYAKDKAEVFDKWLGDGKPAYADRPRLTAERAIELIRGAGGVAVLAHPFTLRIGKESMAKLIAGLAAAGLGGMECYYSEHSADLTKEFLALAEANGLVATGGSDFHGEMSPGVSLGTGFGGLNVPDEVVDRLGALLGCG
jgi:hypothetical protein